MPQVMYQYRGVHHASHQALPLYEPYIQGIQYVVLLVFWYQKQPQYV